MLDARRWILDVVMRNRRLPPAAGHNIQHPASSIEQPETCHV
jgi:hypothetical protein